MISSSSLFPSPLPSSSLSSSNPPLLPHSFLPLPLHRRRFRPIFLSLSDNDRIQSLLFRSEDEIPNHLPAVRTYQSDLCVLSVTGSVDYNQAITAAAADGGVAAEEHLYSGAEAMVVETVFPGRSPEGRSSISTKLFLPTKKVREKAKKLKKNLNGDFLKNSKNILPMTFRQVCLEQLWSFNLRVLTPGTERGLDDFDLPKEEKADFTINSSHEKLLSVLSEAICSFIINHTKTTYHKKTSLPKRISSLDSSICVCIISEKEMMDYFANLEIDDKKWNVEWINEFVPSYKIQIMSNLVNKNKEIKFEGWHKLGEDRLEILLTKFQMMELANVLDMYCEDQYTLPEKRLSIRPILEPIRSTRNNGSLLKAVYATISGCVVIGLLGITTLFFPKVKLNSENNNNIKSCETYSGLLYSPDSPEIENYCKSIVKKVKESLGWSGEIINDSNIGTFIGTIPTYLRDTETESVSNDDLTYQTTENFVKKNSNNLEKVYPEIASFQVVISEEGEIVGFQPTSRLGVNFWASNPLAKDLYKGRNLSPGILEPNLKIPRPKKVFLVELLMSTNPESSFALARPIRDPL
ncbi:hypothetical protein LUZ60_013324 [Juncus effusus]|nr:hypothetical protein LUZ60_013324 [Juncus effusus]